LTPESRTGLSESYGAVQEWFQEVHMQDDDGDFPLSYVLYYVIGATCVIGVVLVGCGYLWLR
jgi:hypothetical protein